MDVKNPLPISTMAETLHALWKLGSLMFVAGSALFTIVWVFARNDIKPFLDLPMQISAMAERMEKLELRVGPRPLVEFLQGTETFPADLRAGENLSVTYQIRRNFNCPTIVTRRFYSVDRGGYDVRFRETAEAVRSPVMANFAPFTITFPIPNLPVGRWGYAPELSAAGDDCPAKEAAYPPIAYFTVVE